MMRTYAIIMTNGMRSPVFVPTGVLEAC